MASMSATSMASDELRSAARQRVVLAADAAIDEFGF
jgi:hypothetical protein